MIQGAKPSRINALTFVFILLSILQQNLRADVNTPAALERPLFDYRQSVLANGLTVITLEDFSTPIVAVQVWYHVGSKNEDPNRQGFAHMFEHMMFKGTDRVSESDHFDLVRQVGGSANGYTSFDRTVYLETLPANQVELALWLEAERMTFLKIDQKRFNTERQVVEEERRMHLNEPYGTVMEKILPEIFTVHPYRWAPIGKIPQLRAASVEELRSFWKKYYVPSNATLIMVGAIKHADAQKLAEKYFGWIPKYPVPQPVDTNEPVNKAKFVVIQEQSAPAPLVGVLYRTVPTRSDDDIPLTLLAQVLGSGQSSRLYRELVAQKQLAVNTVAEDYSLEQAGIFGAGAVLSPMGADPNAVLRIIEEQVAKLRTEPVSDKELTKARNQLLKSLVMDTLTVESKATLLGQAAIDEGNVARVNQKVPQIRKATPQDLLRVAQKYLTPERKIDVRIQSNVVGTITSLVKPKTDSEEEGKITAAPEVNAPPPGRGNLARPSSFPAKPPISKSLATPQIPTYSPTVLPNGMKVFVITQHEVPFITVHLGLLPGAWTESKPGSASMAMKMLTRGTSKHTEAQLADERETYAISLGGNAEMDSSAVSASFVTDQLDRAMRLMAEIVLEPNFPRSEFLKLKRQTLTSLAISTAEPEYMAEQAARKVLYGSHPYSRTDTGEVWDVNSMTLEQAQNWYQQFARPDSASLIFAGDINEPEAVGFAKKYFGNWKAGSKPPEVNLPPIPQIKSRRIFLVDNPGVQSRIRLGQHGITRRDPDYFTSRVVSDYFGFGFNSRLNTSVRVAQGLTYGIWGGYLSKRFAGEFMIDTFTKTNTTAQAVKAVLDQVQQLQDVPPTNDEVAKSKSYIVGSFWERRETPQQLAEDLWLVQSNRLDPDYFNQLLTGVSKTQPSDCTKLVKKTVDPNQTAIVVVGNASAVKAELEKIAPVSMLSLQEPNEPRK